MSTNNPELPMAKVVVAQRGARHRYSIPRLLENANMLEALYTDSCAYSLAGKLACRLGALGLKRSNALAARVPEKIPANKVFSSDRPLVSSLSKGLISPDMSSAYKHWGLQGANVVYSMYGEELDFLRWAKSEGAKIIVDVFISPLSNQVVLDEQVNFDTPSRFRVEPSECDYSADRGVGAFAPFADILLCPSEWVASGVRKFVPEYAHKIRIVPYGSSLHPKSQVGDNLGRILFAGRDPLRKGLPYLAEAVHGLRQSGIKLDVRIAGLERQECDWFPHFKELNYLGLVEMNKMGDEFARADAFVLPSLSEGQAGVLLEALSYGCPVIATKESGVDLTNNENGILVNAGSASQLEAAISQIIQDRSLRAQLSRNGKSFFEQNFSMNMWQERLIQVVLELQS
ncbi:glycosyltransferase family 4 protein [Pontiellaceae bacterium B12227]|nr:glycosyltransferase family 4 protein [Pontiellaceae bacterium B12227]